LHHQHPSLISRTGVHFALARGIVDTDSLQSVRAMPAAHGFVRLGERSTEICVRRVCRDASRFTRSWPSQRVDRDTWAQTGSRNLSGTDSVATLRQGRTVAASLGVDRRRPAVSYWYIWKTALSARIWDSTQHPSFLSITSFAVLPAVRYHAARRREFVSRVNIVKRIKVDGLWKMALG